MTSTGCLKRNFPPLDLRIVRVKVVSLGNISKGSQGTRLLCVFIILHMRCLLGTVGSPRHRLVLCFQYIQHRAALTAALLLFVIVVIYLEEKPVSAWETALL